MIRIYRDPDPAVTVGAGSASTTQPVETSDSSRKGTATVTPESFVVPDAYKDKPYLKGVDSQDKLFKMLDGAQELIGKKGPSRPIDGAPQTEWDAYYESQGRPKTAAEYQFEKVEGVQYDDKLTQGVKDLLFKNGINAATAKELQKGFDTIVVQVVKDKGIQLQEQQKLDLDFDKLGAEAFGAQRDQVLATSKSLIDKFSSEKVKPYVAKLPNESLIVMADVINNINKTYIKQDGAPGAGPTTTGVSPADRSARGRELMASPAYSDPWHKDHERTVKEVKDLYKSGT